MISTQDLSRLLDIAQLKALSQSLALLDAILQPDWQYRYYSFNARWADGEQLASMRDGSGDEYYLLFTPSGAILKGFAHESDMTPYHVEPPQVWTGVLDDVPQVFASFLSEPAFEREATTFCIWREHADTAWRRGNIVFPMREDPDGSADLLAILDNDPRTYQAWAEEYYEHDINLAAIQSIYRHEPVTDALIKSLNAEMSLQALEEDLAEIGYIPS